MTRSFSARGTWPGRVTFRSGWSAAQARPWNEDLEDATLRLDRGGAKMINKCSEWLCSNHAPSVISPPLNNSSVSLWEDAGFERFRTLKLMERDLSIPFAEPVHPIRVGKRSEWEKAAEIDRLAFDETWRVGRLGLADAVAATPRSRFLVADLDDAVVGFAIVGASGPGSYLQRLAVDPAAQGKGIGRALVLACLRWAHTRGANTMVLNTQPTNDPATSLYEAQRFEPLPEPLQLVRYRP